MARGRAAGRTGPVLAAARPRSPGRPGRRRPAPAGQRRARHRQDRAARVRWPSRAGPGARVLRGFCWEGDGRAAVLAVDPGAARDRAAGRRDLGEAGRLLEATERPTEVDGAAAAADAQFRLFDAVAHAADGWPRDGRCAAGRSTTSTGPTSRPCGCWRSWPGRLVDAAGAAARRLPGHRGAPTAARSWPRRAEHCRSRRSTRPTSRLMADLIAGPAPDREREPSRCGSAAAATRSSSAS